MYADVEERQTVSGPVFDLSLLVPLVNTLIFGLVSVVIFGL